jgi:large repetitive protein
LVVTPTANSTTPISLTTSTTGVIDAAGNVVTAPTTYTQAVDTVAPTLTITDSASGVAGGPVTFTYTFSEAVTGFDASKITVAGGTKGAFTAVSSTEYTLVVTPPAGDGNITLSTSTTGVVDTAGNQTVVPNEHIQAYSVVLPTVLISDGTVGAASSAVTYTFTFSEAVTGFTAEKILVTNGTKGTLTTISPSQYSIQITPTLVNANNMTVGINPEGIVNANGYAVVKPFNSQQAAAPATIDLGVDGQLIAPYLVEGKWYYAWDRNKDGQHTSLDNWSFQNFEATFFGSNVGNVVNENNRTFVVNGVTLRLPTLGSDSPSSFSANEFRFNETSWGQATSGWNTTPNSNMIYDDFMAIQDSRDGLGLVPGWISGAVWTATPAGLDLNFRHFLNSNVANASSHFVDNRAYVFEVVDTQQTTMTISDNANNFANGSVLFTFNFNNSISGFDASKINVSGGVKGDFTKLSDSVYTLAVTSTKYIETVSLSFDMTNVIDSNSNSVIAPSRVYNQSFAVPSIDLGVNGQLIAPYQVEGKYYYVWDRNKDGVHDVSDQISMNALEQLVFGSSVGSVMTESNNTFAIGGVNLKLPTIGIQGVVAGTAYTFIGWNSMVPGYDTSSSSNPVYDDLWAIKNSISGVSSSPTGWASNGAYWSSTPGASVDNHYRSWLGETTATTANDGETNRFVAFQVL